MRSRYAFAACALVIAADSAAQTGQNHGAVPAVRAVRAAAPVVVDGVLNDEVWLRAVPVTTFTQREPEEGKPVSEATELRIAYDEEALYVAARLLDREPARIARQLARRDKNAEADSFALFLDAHHDHVTGATFSVSAAGVQRDATIDNDSWTDDSWDAVWESAVKLDAAGWAAELRIDLGGLQPQCEPRRSRKLEPGHRAERPLPAGILARDLGGPELRSDPQPRTVRRHVRRSDRRRNRVNAIFRWEWHPGSALYVVWTEQRQDDDYPGQFQLGRDLGSTLSAPANDVLMFKVAYWFQR